jgi:hypothetical protein
MHQLPTVGRLAKSSVQHGDDATVLPGTHEPTDALSEQGGRPWHIDQLERPRSQGSPARPQQGVIGPRERDPGDRDSG